jgi:hypothetical protein
MQSSYLMRCKRGIGVSYKKIHYSGVDFLKLVWLCVSLLSYVDNLKVQPILSYHTQKKTEYAELFFYVNCFGWALSIR